MSYAISAAASTLVPSRLFLTRPGKARLKMKGMRFDYSRKRANRSNREQPQSANTMRGDKRHAACLLREAITFTGAFMDFEISTASATKSVSPRRPNPPPR